MDIDIFESSCGAILKVHYSSCCGCMTVSCCPICGETIIKDRGIIEFIEIEKEKENDNN